MEQLGISTASVAIFARIATVQKFFFSIELHCMSNRAKISGEIADASPAKKQQTIMLIEDCQEDREVYRRYLQTDLEYEYNFIEAESGEDALEAYRRNRVDVVLLDYLLPDMNGLEWLTQWQQQIDASHCPVIVLTGQGNENIAVQFIKSGAVDYLVKNQLTPEKLKTVVARAIALRQIKIELSKSEKRFRNTFEQVAVGIAHVSLEGHFIEVNRRLCEIVGCKSDRLIKLTFQDITHPEDLTIDLEYVRQLLAGEIKNYAIEKRYIHSNGSIVWINLTVSLVKQDSGEPEYFIFVIEDISDRKKTELALEKSRQKLESNLAKDAFIAHMSHELRTPLNSIIGFSSILQQDPNLIEEQLRNVNIINQSGQHLLILINDILDFSKIEAGKLELKAQNFNLSDFLQDLVDIFSLRAEQKGLNFINQISFFLPIIVKADETRLRQVLLNLLSNAVKFTETGSITFTVFCVEDCVEDRRQRIRFQVEDTGRGIPEDRLAEIFTPFQQLDTHLHDQEGTGLGLTVTQNLLQLMDSNIQLSSTLGEGSRFWFDLELIEVDNPNPSTHVDFGVKANRHLKQPCKVLIVDDNADNRYLLVSYLQPLGFITEEADNGAVGLTKAEIFQPDIILLDLMMPVMNGRETIEQILQQDRLRNIVIFVISANSQSIVNPETLDCDAFIPKPVDLEHLLELMQIHLQLEWITPQNITVKNDKSALVAPPQTELIKLLELVNSGDIEAIAKQIKLLEQSDSQYKSFARETRQFIANFQLFELEKLLSHLIENSTNQQSF